MDGISKEQGFRTWSTTADGLCVLIDPCQVKTFRTGTEYSYRIIGSAKDYCHIYIYIMQKLMGKSGGMVRLLLGLANGDTLAINMPI